MKFEIVGAIANPQAIASGIGARIRSYLRKAYGAGRWRKVQGVATSEPGPDSAPLARGLSVFTESHGHSTGVE
jgi:hypothetical protein